MDVCKADLRFAFSTTVLMRREGNTCNLFRIGYGQLFWLTPFEQTSNGSGLEGQVKSWELEEA